MTRTFKPNPLWMLLAAAIPLAGAARAQPVDPAPPQGFVTVVGEGVSWVMPDVATVRLTVATQAKSPKQAFEANSAKVAAVVEAAGAAGVPQSQIRSEKLQAGAPEGGGFQVRHVLVAKVRGLSRVGDLMERSAQAGATDISGLEFGTEESLLAARDARQRAAKDAEDRARSYAQGLGLRLGRIVSVSDTEARPPEPPPTDRPPVEFGRTEVRAKVSVVWEIDGSVPKAP